MSCNKEELQEAGYEFPYHHIPHFEDDVIPLVSRRLAWGLHYLCYQRHLREMVCKVSPSRVLEVGCGDGYFLGTLPDTIGKKVGVDLSSRAIAYARAFNPNCEFYVKDIGDVEGEYDAVVTIEVLEHVPDDRVTEFLTAMIKRIRPGGMLLVSVPTTVVPVHPKHYRHYTIDLLKNQLDATGLSLGEVSFDYIYHEPFWMKLLVMLVGNRWFSVECRPLMKWAWGRLWGKHRYATERTGRHIAAMIEKP